MYWFSLLLYGPCQVASEALVELWGLCFLLSVAHQEIALKSNGLLAPIISLNVASWNLPRKIGSKKINWYCLFCAFVWCILFTPGCQKYGRRLICRICDRQWDLVLDLSNHLSNSWFVSSIPRFCAFILGSEFYKILLLNNCVQNLCIKLFAYASVKVFSSCILLQGYLLLTDWKWNYNKCLYPVLK